MRAFLDIAEMAAILAAVALVGFPMVRGIPRLSRAEVAAWAWVAGLLTLAASEGVLLAVGSRPDPWKLWALVAAASLAFHVRSSAAPRAFSPSGRIGIVAWTIALGGLTLFAVEAVSEPISAWDFVAIWGLKGKTFFLSSGSLARFFYEPQIAFVHPKYPLLLPALFAAFSTLLGTWDSQALALLYPSFELATLLVVWGFLRRRCGPAGAATAVVLTAGFFPLYQSYLVGLAEIPLALGFVLAATALLDALEAKGAWQFRPLVLSALFCCTLKNEGTLFLLLLAAISAIHIRGTVSFTAAATLASVPLCHLAILRWLLASATDQRFKWSVVASRGGAELARRLSETEGYLLHATAIPCLPALLAIATILLCTRSGIADMFLWPVSLLVVLYAIAPAVSTVFDPALFASTTFERICGALVPTLFLVLGARISASAEEFSFRLSRARPEFN